MGRISQPPPVKLFAGVLTSRPELFGEVESRLTPLFGPVDLRSERFPFDATDYYTPEMGGPIERQFLAFDALIEAPTLAEIKVRTNRIEADFGGGTGLRRPVNLDPGYIEQAKVVLASTEMTSHGWGGNPRSRPRPEPQQGRSRTVNIPPLLYSTAAPR